VTHCVKECCIESNIHTCTVLPLKCSCGSQSLSARRHRIASFLLKMRKTTLNSMLFLQVHTFYIHLFVFLCCFMGLTLLIGECVDVYHLYIHVRAESYFTNSAHFARTRLHCSGDPSTINVFLGRFELERLAEQWALELIWNINSSVAFNLFLCLAKLAFWPEY